MASGAPALLSAEIEKWRHETVLNSTPEDHGYDTWLWIHKILAELIKKYFLIEASGRTVSEHLGKIDLTYQKPRYRATEQNPEKNTTGQVLTSRNSQMQYSK